MTGENGTPETPEWRLAPREQWIDHDGPDAWMVRFPGLRCSCDVCRKAEPDGFGVYPLPENIVLGTE